MTGENQDTVFYDPVTFCFFIFQLSSLLFFRRQGFVSFILDAGQAGYFLF